MIDDYLSFLRFKSISADKSFQQDCLDCAKWLENFLQKEGFHTELLQTSTNPALLAFDLSAGPSARTLLFYQHYDVQPFDPLELLVNDPFEHT
ncbi:MAG: peptidase, partial [Chlamydiota bacterium]